jgi:hypothetical protein
LEAAVDYANRAAKIVKSLLNTVYKIYVTIFRQKIIQIRLFVTMLRIFRGNYKEKHFGYFRGGEKKKIKKENYHGYGHSDRTRTIVFFYFVYFYSNNLKLN